MSVKIAHASKDENKQCKNGQAGDQTKVEVYITDWYSRPWNYIIRCKNTNMREKIAYAMEAACNNDLIGYDQNQRNTLLNQVRGLGYDPSKVTIPCECDCSSLVSVACMYAGVPEDILYVSNNSAVTSNIRNRLISTGDFEAFADSKYISSSDYLLRGDILLSEGHHVAVAVSNGAKVSTATTTAINTNTNSFNMIDISHHNTIKSFSSLSSDVNNIIIRMGYIAAKTGILTTDKKFKEHIEGAINQNINIGLYCWDQSLNENEAIALADYCINAANPYKNNINLPIFIDSENYNSKREGRADNISKEQRTKNLIAFCERVKSKGYTPGIYASESWFKSQVNFDNLKNYIIWCAKYSINKPNISKYDIWQCGSKEFIWASAPIDINIIYNNIKNVSNTSNTTTNTETTETTYVLGKVTASTLNIRSTYNTSGNIVGTYKNGSLVRLLQTNNGWYKTNKGWISGKYVNTNIIGTVVNCNALNVRKEPKIVNGNVMFSISKDTKVKIIDLSDDDKWIKVSVNNKIGWCSANYIKH